jgi:DNA mismatch endonuclease (patch repair protein)
MGNVRGKDTAPEMALRKALHRLGLRFRLHVAKLPGRPDIVLPKFRTVILVHGCFWHRHPNCSASTVPKTNAEFWREKFSKNVIRDRKNIDELRELGWRVFVTWQCEVSSSKKTEETATALVSQIRQASLDTSPK